MCAYRISAWLVLTSETRQALSKPRVTQIRCCGWRNRGLCAHWHQCSAFQRAASQRAQQTLSDVLLTQLTRRIHATMWLYQRKHTSSSLSVHTSESHKNTVPSVVLISKWKDVSAQIFRCSVCLLAELDEWAALKFKQCLGEIVHRWAKNTTACMRNLNGALF